MPVRPVRPAIPQTGAGGARLLDVGVQLRPLAPRNFGIDGRRGRFHDADQFVEALVGAGPDRIMFLKIVAEMGNKRSTCVITSAASPPECGNSRPAVRGHWTLDVTFREGESRIRKDHGPDNFSFLRRLAITAKTTDNNTHWVASERV